MGGVATLNDLKTMVLKWRYGWLVGLLLAAMTGLSILRMQGLKRAVAFHQYLLGDFQLSNLSLVGVLLILLPGVVLWPLIKALAARGTGAVRAWQNVLVVSGWHILYSVVILQGLKLIAPLPMPTAKTVYTNLDASLTGDFLGAGGGLIFWLVIIGLVQLGLAESHPRWAQWCPLSLVPLLPGIVGLSVVFPTQLTKVAAVVTAVAPLLIPLIVGGAFGVIISYVDRMSRRKNVQQKTAAS